MSMPLTPLSGGVILPYECHEGNGAVKNSLGAERAEDAAIAADLAKGIKRARRPAQDGLGVGGQPIGEGGRGGGGRDAALAPARRRSAAAAVDQRPRLKATGQRLPA